jgi:hypothetical protein
MGLRYHLKYRGICPICNATLIKFDKGRLLCLNCFGYFNHWDKPLTGEFRTCEGCGKLMYRFPCKLKKEQEHPNWGKKCRQCTNKSMIPPQNRYGKIVNGKNDYAVALGKVAGIKGGTARALKLSKARRTEIAQRAARVRWAKYRQAKILGGEQICQPSQEHSNTVLFAAPSTIMA